MSTNKITMKIALLVTALTLALPFWTSTASAQTPSTGFGVGSMKVPGAAKPKTGKGLSFGRSIFHAGLSVEAGWDSNVFYEDSQPRSSAYMRLLPQLTLGSRPVAAGKQQKFIYNLALGMDYIGYLQELPGGAHQHHFGASLGANLKYNPKGVVGFGLVEQFVRTNEPRLGVHMGGSVDRDYNQVGLDLIINKGLLSFLVGYRFILDYFEDSEMAFANRMIHRANFKATWRFFPQTSFWFKAETGFVDYMEDFNVGAIGTTGAGNRNSVPLRLWVGATGRLTHWLTADIALGYGYAHYLGDQPPDDHHDVIANLGVGFRLGTVANLRLGYRHDFRDSAVGDFFKSDSAYLRLNVAIVQRLLLSAVFAWTRADYQNYYVDTTMYQRTDNYLSGTLGADYYFLSWLSAGVGYVLQGNVSSTDAMYGVLPVASGFVKHRVFGRVSAYY